MRVEQGESAICFTRLVGRIFFALNLAVRCIVRVVTRGCMRVSCCVKVALRGSMVRETYPILSPYFLCFFWVSDKKIAINPVPLPGSASG